jgi:cell division protein FtsL
MTRLNPILLLALMVSSVYLVQVSYDERRLYAALDRARTEQRQLETEYGRLQAEHQAQATPARIDKTARDKLHMVPATTAIMKQVVVSAAPTASQGRP